MSDSTPTLTFGEKAVGLTFNPSNNEAVDHIKRAHADLIDLAHRMRTAPGVSQDIARMASLAITDLQTSQMWLVKAATWAH